MAVCRNPIVHLGHIVAGRPKSSSEMFKCVGSWEVSAEQQVTFEMLVTDVLRVCRLEVTESHGTKHVSLLMFAIVSHNYCILCPLTLQFHNLSPLVLSWYIHCVPKIQRLAPQFPPRHI